MNIMYVSIVAPLTCLIEKDKFVWNEKAEEAFETLKKAFTSTPIFVHADSSKSYFLEANALGLSYRTSRGLLSDKMDGRTDGPGHYGWMVPDGGTIHR